ncbi:MAG TPA: hypothetical protein VGJ15_13095 [Pirellulales bacterium]
MSREANLNPRPYVIGFCTVVVMVALRCAIGWHFFSEGLAHKNDPKWTSEGFLRAAKGPLAGMYKDRLPTDHDFEKLVLIPAVPEKEANDTIAAGGEVAQGGGSAVKSPAKSNGIGGDSAVYGTWYNNIVHDWDQQRNQIANFYRFNNEQMGSSNALLDDYEHKLTAVLAGYGADILQYRHSLWRNGQLKTEAGADNIPNLKTRIAKRDAAPTGEPAVGGGVGSSPNDWRSDVQALDQAFLSDALALRLADQVKLGDLPREKTELQKIDSVIPWMLMIAGGCLLIGLFSRISAIVCALFLASVIATQPPWVPGAITMLFNYQLVELLALILLATSHVGRWAGLDFFVHHVLLRPLRSSRKS